MEITVYDYRNKYHTGSQQSLGKSAGLTVTKAGDINIKKTDLLYALKIHLNPEEVEDLYAKLDAIMEYRGRKKKRAHILDAADQILKEKRL